jgi:hypothetical protein
MTRSCVIQALANPLQQNDVSPGWRQPPTPLARGPRILAEEENGPERFLFPEIGQAMSATKTAWYIDERVKALAIMHLTRRDDLVVKDEVRESGQIPDFVVQIISPVKMG